MAGQAGQAVCFLSGPAWRPQAQDKRPQAQDKGDIRLVGPQSVPTGQPRDLAREPRGVDLRRRRKERRGEGLGWGRD